jgi:2-oxoisovalerate dehydrogenase E1 component beta subunit
VSGPQTAKGPQKKAKEAPDTTSYIEAIRQAMDEEMDRDEQVILLGEDIGAYGGAFRATDGLFDKYGPERVRDTPISESAMVGVAIGASIEGMRPVVEMQFADFISCAFDQVVNTAATFRYRSGGRVSVPMVIRCPYGGRIHGAIFHSQCPEAWFTRTPGLKVAVPATAYDAKGLLKAAIRDADPVLFFEHKYLYRRIKEILPTDREVFTPLGQAAVRRQGDHLTVVTYGAMVHDCLEAAEQVAKEDGVEAEVIDLRTLVPLDWETVLASVKKSSKVLLVQEDKFTGGMASDLAARIADEAFEHLDGPVLRVTAPDTPVPFSPPLEEFYQPSAEKVVEAMRRLAAY